MCPHADCILKSKNPEYIPNIGTLTLAGSRRWEIHFGGIHSSPLKRLAIRVAWEIKPFNRKWSVVILSAGSKMNFWSVFLDFSRLKDFKSSLARQDRRCAQGNRYLHSKKNDGVHPLATLEAVIFNFVTFLALTDTLCGWCFSQSFGHCSLIIRDTWQNLKSD